VTRCPVAPVLANGAVRGDHGAVGIPGPETALTVGRRLERDEEFEVLALIAAGGARLGKLSPVR
jgi:hypothetical protein